MIGRTQDTQALTIKEGQILNSSAKALAIRQGKGSAAGYVRHLSEGDVKLMCIVAGKGRNGERNRLLIATLFDGCLRVSEALSITPAAITREAEGYAVSIMGKGHKPGKVAISSSLASELRNYCYENNIAKEARIFPINDLSSGT